MEKGGIYVAKAKYIRSLPISFKLPTGTGTLYGPPAQDLDAFRVFETRSIEGYSVGDPDPGPGSGAFLTPGSGIGFFRIPNLGFQTHIFESLLTIFWVRSSIIL